MNSFLLNGTRKCCVNDMNNVHYEWNDAGFIELLKDPALKAQMQSLGEEVANRAEGNYEVVVIDKGKRSVVNIVVADTQTYYRNLHGDHLLHAL